MKLLSSTERADPRSLQLLKRLGFSGYEAAVWLELAQGYPATAYQVAKRAGLQRANTYRALERLCELEAVTVVHDRPVTYAPADPKSMVGRLTAGLAGECDWFAGQMTRRMQSRNRGSIRTASGAEACLDFLRQELGAATRYVWIKGEGTTIRSLAEDIEAAVLRGVQITVIAFGPWRALRRRFASCRVYPHEGNGVRLTSATDALLTLARDGRSVTTAVFTDAPTVTSLQDHALTYQLHSYLLHEIFLAELAAGPEGAAIAGELKRLRSLHRPPGMERPLLGDAG
ncbi:MAG: hypothetical protein ABS43_08890 [Bordetella sp. SCN 67-23]|nr:hypothetical protein [Burkholderiales bacterium]ODS74610.1 MAG: hypothetical protein ABS43_08890 [Bordetella sp. SCN 67-23]OJW92335.1 MAG: hypothetical protein BGO71_07525 [Burkholderiales bacterium 67-32]